MFPSEITTVSTVSTFSMERICRKKGVADYRVSPSSRKAGEARVGRSSENTLLVETWRRKEILPMRNVTPPCRLHLFCLHL